MAPELTEDNVVNLVTLISDHYQQFKLLYPKIHYIVHMPRLILEWVYANNKSQTDIISH